MKSQFEVLPLHDKEGTRVDYIVFYANVGNLPVKKADAYCKQLYTKFKPKFPNNDLIVVPVRDFE